MSPPPPLPPAQAGACGLAARNREEQLGPFQSGRLFRQQCDEHLLYTSALDCGRGREKRLRVGRRVTQVTWEEGGRAGIGVQARLSANNPRCCAIGDVARANCFHCIPQPPQEGDSIIPLIVTVSDLTLLPCLTSLHFPPCC